MRKHTLLKLTVSLFLASAALAAPAQEQLNTPPSQVERKNLAPVSKELLKVSLPKAYETTLSNGLTVLIMEDHKLPLVSVEYFMAGAGPLYEPKDLPGLASITAQL